MIALGERLRATVAAVKDRPVTWGVDDCTTWPAQWTVDVTGRTLPQWPDYASEAEARALIDAAGGLVPLWDEAARALRVPVRHEAPEPGDVGVILTGRHGPVGVIFGHGGVAFWRSSSADGTRGGVHALTPRRVTLVRAWAVADCAFA